ncbi:retrovirus-related Pol polyprotein from transposon 17.6 [Trichonephila clavipes]|nr:retrovirus-related Pol polyprotein from transposon 17.6 [Trichonephila clavipes]
MVEAGIIIKVEEPTEWVSNMVGIDSPKKLRICLDPRSLNEAIQRPHYPIPTADALITKLQGGKMLTILDAKNGFWRLPLDKESSYLTTFCTPWGRYRFLVLPFGLSSAPEEFQKAMEEIYEEDEDTNPYFDDMHWLSQTSVNYLCHVLSDKGIKPDPKKIRAIEELATPNCKEDLQRFLGMVTYLAKFTPHLSNLTHNLGQLLKKDSMWIWDTNTERDFELVKQAIMKSPCLKYFNGNKAVTVSVDASKNALGAVLLQEGQPVAYGYVSLTQTQQHYAQIEKELMAVIYGLEHFNYYTYGRIVTVQTDHKPILGLIGICSRKNLVTADVLSRAQSTTDNFYEVLGQEATVRINLLTQASPTKWEEITSLTAGDPEMQDVLFHINNGWPLKKKTKIAAQPYCQRTSVNDRLFVQVCCELKPLISTTAQSVITVMKSIYATHGIPEKLVNDGGPPYNSNLMMNFFREWGIKHHVTPPRFPRANGQIERAVQTVKKFSY